MNKIKYKRICHMCNREDCDLTKPQCRFLNQYRYYKEDDLEYIDGRYYVKLNDKNHIKLNSNENL